MIDEKVVKLEARLSAIEYFLCEAFRIVYTMSGATPHDIDESHQHFLKYLQTMPMPPCDPAISDAAAAEIQESHGRLLKMIGDTAKAVRAEV